MDIGDQLIKQTAARPCGPWVKNFAWHPVFPFDAGWVWLVSIWRRQLARRTPCDGIVYKSQFRRLPEKEF